MVKQKDKFTEEFTFKMLSDFFNIKGENFIIINVFRNLYDYSKNEQDIIVIYDKYILCFECKAEKFNEPFRDPKKEYERLKRNFKTSIQKAYEQAYRVKIAVEKKPPESYYYNSDKEEKRKKIIDVSGISKDNVLLIAVTLDNYLNLSTEVDILLDRVNGTKDYPLAIDVFSLHTILDTCLFLQNTEHQKEKNYARRLFIDYCIRRTKSSENISSPNSSELDVFGAFISKTYNIGAPNVFNSQRDSYTVMFGNSFSRNVLSHINEYEAEVLYGYPESEMDILKDDSFPKYIR